MDFINIPLTVAGWGKTRQGALTSSRYLLETKVQIVDSAKCRKSSIYRDNLVPDTMMCAYNLGKDACQVSEYNIYLRGLYIFILTSNK